MGIGDEMTPGESRADHIRIETALHRSRTYELLSYVFAAPSSDFLNFVSEGEFLRHIKESLAKHPCGVQMDAGALISVTGEAKDIDIDDLRSEYAKMVAPEMNFLYECNYHPHLNSSEEMADVAGFYRAFGMGFTGERPDHISMELEFMRLLAMKEAKSLIDGNPENKEICISAEEKFLYSHLGRWTATLANMTSGIRFYGSFSRLIKEWIDVECSYMSVKTDEIFYTSRTEPGEENSDCFLKEAAHEGI